MLLTPGPYNETYFEHAYLARYLGFTLVEGGDLTVRDRRVFGYPENPILHSGPRVGQSLEMIARMIHPEAWRDAESVK